LLPGKGTVASAGRLAVFRSAARRIDRPISVLR
jgi:hypothetical protein